jgi:aconitate hydratase
VLAINDVRNAVQRGKTISVINKTKSESYKAEHGMSERQVAMVLKGSLINLVK